MITTGTVLLVALLGLTVGIICGVVLSAFLLANNVISWTKAAVKAISEGSTVMVGDDITIRGDLQVEARKKCTDT